MTGMETDGFGRKIGDFKEESYKDAQNNDAIRRTVYNPDKTVNVIHTTKKPNGTKIVSESLFDENDLELQTTYIELDKEGNEVYSTGVNYSYYEDGSVRSENIIVDRQKGTQLHYFEDWQNEYDTTTTAEGELLDKDGKKLADYSFEKTFFGDGSVVRVDTFIYPNGRVDLISKKVDAEGNITVNKQLDFKAAGEPEEENAGSEWDDLYDWFLNIEADGLDEIDEETLRYFEEISDVWGENIVETGDGRGNGLNEELDEVLDDRGEENGMAGEDDDEINDVPDEENGEDGADDEISDVPGEENGGAGEDDGVISDVPDEDNGAVSEDNGGSYDGGSYDGGSYDGGSDDGGSYDGGSDDGGSDDGGWDDDGSDD